MTVKAEQINSKFKRNNENKTYQTPSGFDSKKAELRQKIEDRHEQLEFEREYGKAA